MANTEGPTVVYINPPRTFGSESTAVTCPNCGNHVSTRVRKKATLSTHLCALLLCIIFCPCVCVPYCSNCCKKTNHYCPNCGALLGTYQD